MKTRFEQRVKVLSSMTDVNANVGLTHTLSYLQDNMSEYFQSMGCDGLTMIPIAKCFWVMTKTKVKFNSTIKWLDEIILETDLCKETNIRLNIFNNILDDKGNYLVEGIQEICAVDSETRKVRTVDSTILPKDIDIDESKIPTLKFTRFDEELEKENYIKDIVIDSRNIDFFGHTNNVEYARFMLSTFTGNEVKNMIPREFEIHYIAESRESDVLSIYRKSTGNSHYFEIKNGDKVISKAMLITANK